MNFFYTLGKNPVRLFILSQTLLLLTFVLRDFPILAFFAFAPLLALVDHPSALKDSYLPFLVALLTAFIFYYSMQESMYQSSIISWIIYFSFLAAVFTTYIFLQAWSNNRLNKFALIIFILGMEYVLLSLMSEPNPVFLADLLKYQPAWTRWNIVTGYTGTSMWILLVNLLFYQGLFGRERVNIATCIAGVLMLAIPLLYSLTLDGMPIVKTDVINLYADAVVSHGNYAERGELISRTGAWVSALIIIFTIIIGVIKKKSR